MFEMVVERHCVAGADGSDSLMSTHRATQLEVLGFAPRVSYADATCVDLSVVSRSELVSFAKKSKVLIVTEDGTKVCCQSGMSYVQCVCSSWCIDGIAVWATISVGNVSIVLSTACAVRLDSL